MKLDLFIAMLTAPLLWGAAPRPPPSEEARCEVASAYVAAVLANPSYRSIVLRTDGPGGDWDNELQWVDPVALRSGSKPPRDLLAEAKGKTGESAVARCASLRTLLDQRGVAYGNEAVRQVTASPRQGLKYEKTVMSISLPVISRDGQHALLVDGHESGGLSNGGVLVHLRLSSTNGWNVTSVTTLWVG